MCGICGRLNFDSGREVSPALLKAMTTAIQHRGPDDEGFYQSGPIGLGFRRLSIIDLARGHQPLSNEDGTVWIAFNGEIYNFQELRKRLEPRHVFKTKTDTEVIVHLYEEYGEECVQELRGMFAFAIWDSRKRTLLLARDRVGIKPLYYYLDNHFLSFGSEVKAILADPSVSREVDPEIVDRFLTYRYVPGRQTLHRNIFKLEPGHILSAREDGTTQMRRYWDLDYGETPSAPSPRGFAEDLLELLDETVQLHMISDVPVGFLLSGGVDSTAMLALAAPKTSEPISSYTVGFAGMGVVDERPYARLAAERYHSKHYEITISPDEFSSFLPEYIRYMEEPVCEPPAIALYYVSKLASAHVKVLISGEGGDEAFAGYENYRNTVWFEKLKAALGPLQTPVGAGMSMLGRMLDSRVLQQYGPRVTQRFEDYFQSRTSSPHQLFNHDKSSFYSQEMAELINRDRSIAVTREYMSRASGFGLLDKMLYVDTKTWLPDDLLLKADKMTMANSLELRVPLLDHKVLEFAARLPRNQKVHGWAMKYILKQSLRNTVPHEILHRRKAGFPVPYGMWLQTDKTLRNWVCDVLTDSKTVSRGYFKPGAITNLIDHSGHTPKYSQEIFSLVVLELWHRAFADGQYDAATQAESLVRV
jgi:asparagine synthase (glutamine-hydrolysing)